MKVLTTMIGLMMLTKLEELPEGFSRGLQLLIVLHFTEMITGEKG